MKKFLTTMLFAGALALFLPAAALAQSLEQAAAKAARQHNAKVLSARTVKQGKQDVHVIKLLTKKGVVKTVRVPDRRKKNPN